MNDKHLLRNRVSIQGKQASKKKSYQYILFLLLDFRIFKQKTYQFSGGLLSLSQTAATHHNLFVFISSPLFSVHWRTNIIHICRLQISQHFI